MAIERALDWNIPLFDGVNWIRNEEKHDISQGRSLSGFSRLTAALSNFLNSHTFSFELDTTIGSPRKLDRGGGGGGGEGGGFGGGGGGGGGGLLGFNKKAIQKEKRYMKYAFMVLLGIFGLTGPIVMKTLAIMAAKALLASKAALIIVGSVMLKKIFEHDSHDKKSTIKVHTIPSYDHDDDHDRISYNNQNNIPYSPYTSSYSSYSSPYYNSYPYTKS